MIADIAERYVRDYGFKLVTIPHKKKFSSADEWQNKTLNTPDQARAYYEENPHANMGVLLESPGFCSLDIDCIESTRIVLEDLGFAVDELIANNPTIQGNAATGCRIMFRQPADGVGYAKLSWPQQTDRKRSYTVFELRGSCDGKARQDVLPPSIHPDTNMPYVWLTEPPVSVDDWPEPPEWLLVLWREWDKTKHQIQSICPWGEQVTAPPPRKKTTKADYRGVSIIDEYCRTTDLHAELVRYGYKRCGRRYLSPHSSTGLPGVMVFPDNESCWIHHASDPLCSEASGQPVNAFDLYAYYEHNGDMSKAAKSLIEPLGLKSLPQPIKTNEPVPVQRETMSVPVSHGRAAPVDMEAPLIHVNQNGKPLKHVANLAEICRRLGIVIRYNVIAKEEEIIIPGHGYSVDNEANAAMAWLMSECSLFNMDTGGIDGMVTFLADRNQYNPVASWIESKAWDGQPRLINLCETITTDGSSELRNTLIKRWMISAVAAAYSSRGISAAGVLTLQGDQYIGKTKWLKGLVPTSSELFKDGVILRVDDKDSVKQAVSFWITELGELDDTFKKSGASALKAFLTQDNDVLRRAYARKESKYPRRTVFAASVNPKQYLNDPTGNRRYWTVSATHINHEHGLDMQQVWAEVKHLLDGGEGYYLTQDEMALLNNSNEMYTSSDPVEELILTRLDWDSPMDVWTWITATDVLYRIGDDRPDIASARSCSSFIRKHNKGQSKRSNGKTLLLTPPEKTMLSR